MNCLSPEGGRFLTSSRHSFNIASRTLTAEAVGTTLLALPEGSPSFGLRVMTDRQTEDTVAEGSAAEAASASLAPSDIQPNYRVWASDNQVYGPVDIAVLIEWAKDSRVFADTWIYADPPRAWQRAKILPALKPFLPASEDTLFLSKQTISGEGIDPYELRLFPLLAGLSNCDLAHFIRLSQLKVVEPGELVIRRRDPGDSIFFVLSGAMRARLIIGYDEKEMADIPAGEFFGEMSMFTNSPRTADIMAREKSRLLRFSAGAFHALIRDNPSVAAPLLYNISRSMAQRILDTNTKFQNEVAAGFIWR